MPYISVRALSTENKAMVFVEEKTTIAELKLKIQEPMGVHSRHQCLVYKGRDLKNAQTIDDCNIEEATSITLFDTTHDTASVATHGTTASNIGTAGVAMGLWAADDIEGLVGLCAENIVIYHNPSSTIAPMYGRYFGIEGFAMWLKECSDQLEQKAKPRLFNFSSSGNYVFLEAELDVTVKATSKSVTISRIMKLVFNERGQFVVWDIMEDSAQMLEAYKPKVFRAPDGTEFATRRQVFRYWFNFADKSGETLVRNPGEINGQPFDVSDCKDCTIVLADYTDQVRLDNLENCRIFVGASSESVWMRNCKGCQITVACREFRAFDTTGCVAHVLCMAPPILERCSEITLRPHNAKYELMKRHLTAARLDVYKNQYLKVEDLSAAEASAPNFKTERSPEGPWELTEEDVTEVRLAAETRVEGRFAGGTIWYPGTICTSHDDGTYKVLYDDGDIEDHVAREFVRTV